MSLNWLRKFSDNRTPTWILKILGNVWGPYLGAGIEVIEVAENLRHIKVRLKRRWYNGNYVGTQFGGSIYAMTDPFYMLMLMENLGRDFIVWDKAANIRFRKPGRTDLYATFELAEAEIAAIVERLKSEPKIDWEKDVLVTDPEGMTIAEVHKTVYIKKK